MKQWVLSRYTSLIKGESGETLLYNSFMGAIARVSKQQYKNIAKFIANGFTNTDIVGNKILAELSRGGFFTPENSDEQKKVSKLLDQERDSNRFSILILPSENCNFRCLYCYEKFERGKMEPGIVQGLKLFVDKKIRETKGLKELSVSWFGGEPLLAQDIISELSDHFIASCRKNNIVYISGGMSTNGFFLTPEAVNLMLKHQIKNFQVTLDGPEALHDSHRQLASGGKTYKRILENLTKMKASQDDFFVRIRINFNNESAAAIKKWLKKEIAPIFSDNKRFALSFNSIGRWGGKNDAALAVCDSLSASKLRAEFAVQSQLYDFSDKAVKEPLMPHGNVCFASKESSLVIGSNGNIYKCTVALDDPRNLVGKLTADGRLKINQTLWDKWTKIDDKDTSWCEVCSFYPSCQGRKCPLAAMNQKKPACPMTKKEYETLIKLAAGVKK